MELAADPDRGSPDDFHAPLVDPLVNNFTIFPRTHPSLPEEVKSPSLGGWVLARS